MWEILFIFLCIVLNAVLAGIEIAFVSVNKTFLRHRVKQGDYKAKRLLALKEKPERTLSTIQIGITLLASLTAAVGGAAAGINIIPILHETFQISLPVAEIIAILLVVTPITYFSVVIGEITPKALALRNPYFFATLGTPILIRLSNFFYPIVRLCEKSTKMLLEMIPLQKTQERDREKEYHEYEKLLTSYHGLPQKGKEYMINLSKIQEKTVEDILLKWDEVDYVSTDQELHEIVEKIISSGHTRMPVVDNGQVVGLINTKEILAFSRCKDINWRKLMHTPVYFKKDSSPIDSLNTLQGKRIHMGIVEGDHNIPIGIITIEDIIEEVLGEIYDEDDRGSLQRILGRNE
jgi:magnesium and cobalt exporter, CNNM family